MTVFITRPGPVDKQGYSAYLSPQPKEGFVLHSMQGPYSAGLGVLDGPRRSSWNASIRKDGVVVEHYDKGAVTWHCGDMGDNNPYTVAIGNVGLIGIEHEGGTPPHLSEPLTEPQIQASIDYIVACYRAGVVTVPFQRHVSAFEHNEIVPTACPTGRIPWDRMISGVQAALAPSPPEVSMALNIPLYRQTNDDEVYALFTYPGNFSVLVWVPGAQYIADWSKVQAVPENDPIWRTLTLGPTA